MKGYSFTELAKLVEAAMPRAGGAFSGNVSAPRFIGPLQGNADTATAAGSADKLSAARNITIGNTTKAFDGTGNLSWSLAEIGAINASATVAAAHKWATPRALKVGNSSKAVDGTANVAWSLAEIGAVNKAGDTMTGRLTIQQDTGALGVAVGKTGQHAGLGISATPGEYLVGGATDGGGTFSTYLRIGETTLTYSPAAEKQYMIYHQGFKPTAADVGAVSKAGDTVTGTLTLDGIVNIKSSNLRIENVNVIGASSTVVRVGDGDFTRPLNLNAKDGLVYVQQPGDVEHQVYHTGYKPTATDVGALASDGTAVAATKLATARQIGGVAFDGTANINLPGVNTAGNQNTTGNAATATKLATARTLTIGSTDRAFDGTGNLSWSLSEIGAVNKAGDTMTGTLNFANSGTAKRGIHGTSGTNDYWFVGGGATAHNDGYMEIATADDGSEPIYVRQYTGDFVTIARSATLLDGSGNTSFPGNVSAAAFLGNASTASKLQTGRSIALGGDLSGSATFDGSANITITAIVADGSHTHTIANVNGLQTALDGKKAVAVLSGTIANGGTIPLPSGFTEEQCKWLVSMNDSNVNGSGWDVREGLSTNHYKTQCYTTGRVVTATMYAYNDTNDSGVTYAASANYIIIGVK